MGTTSRGRRTHPRTSLNHPRRPVPHHARTENGVPSPQRYADALVSIAHDSLNGNQTEGTAPGPVVSIFVDAHLAVSTNGETGAEIATGPRVGPLTLEQILCHGQTEILMTAPDGTPLAVGPTSKTIPPKLRRFILHRDGGACTADGCQSRYRLQPHHITPKSPRRITRSLEPDHPLLVPPPCGHPPQRLPNRPQQRHPNDAASSNPKAAAHPERRSPTLNTLQAEAARTTSPRNEKTGSTSPERQFWRDPTLSKPCKDWTATPTRLA